MKDQLLKLHWTKILQVDTETVRSILNNCLLFSLLSFHVVGYAVVCHLRLQAYGEDDLTELGSAKPVDVPAKDA